MTSPGPIFRLLSILLALAIFPSGTPAQERTIGHALGPADADVVVIAFTDFGCSACSLFARQTFPALREEYIRTGTIRWIEVPFVLGSFRNTEAAAMAAECAAEQDGFWAMYDVLFQRQAQWAQATDPWERFPEYAAEIGLDGDGFRECQNGGPRIETERGNEVAAAGGVRATPTFFINGERLEGALELDAFRAILDEALGRP